MTSERTKLSVNLNKIALLRNARPLNIPDLAEMAGICIVAGAHGITVHPRPDQRHVRYRDVPELAARLRAHPEVEYNIEGNPFTGDFLSLVKQARPTQCTLVPDDPQQSTSDHGWDVAGDGERLRPVIRELNELGVRVSLFMDADEDAIARAADLDLGAARVELYTEPYAAAFAAGDPQPSLRRFRDAARRARASGFGVNAGHDLNLDNLPGFVAAVDGVLECSIGHALIADALRDGLAATVRRYLAALGHGRA